MVFRVGLVGTESSHADGIVGYLRSRPEAARVVAVVGPADERNRGLAGDGVVVASAGELLGMVDAVIVTSRDGAAHRQLAVPFLAAGVPVWVDKPLATRVVDAEAMMAAARRGGTTVTSYSALRWLPDAEGFGRGPAVTVSGPADPGSVYGGIFFYGIHVADLAQRLAPGEPGPVAVTHEDGAIVARYECGGVAVTLRFVAEGPFEVEVAGWGRREIRLDADYVVPGVQVFLEMLASGVAPLEDATMLAPIRVLEQVRAQLAGLRAG